MKNRLGILLFCLFVVMIGYGLTLPVLAFYIELLALAEGATAWKAYIHVGLLTGIFALMQFFFAPVWGMWSDRIGRRPLFMIGLICGFIMAAAQAGVVGWLIGRVGEMPMLSLGFGLMGTALILLMTTQTMMFILFYVVLFALGMAALNPSLASLVSKRSGKNAGAALGLQTAANSLGQAAGPLVGSILFT